MIDDRPLLETVVENYDVMLDEMRALIESESVIGSWSSARNATAVEVDAATADVIGESALWSFTDSVSRDFLARAILLSSLSRIGERYGFSPLVITSSTLGEFQSIASDEFGARYEFGGMDHSTLTYTTGRHPSKAFARRLVR